MTAYTTPVGIPYPETTDRVADGWDAIRDLAEKVDDEFVADRVALAGKATAADIAALDARLDALEAATLDTGWTALTLNSGWSNYAGGFRAAAYRKRGGFVTLRGLVKRAGVGSTSIGTLPAGYRPGGLDMYAGVGLSYFNDLTIAGEWVNLADIGVRCEINASGVITPTNKIYSGTSETPYFSLAGITFIAEA